MGTSASAALLSGVASALPLPDEAPTEEVVPAPPSQTQTADPSVQEEEDAEPAHGLTVAADASCPAPDAPEGRCPPTPPPAACCCQTAPASAGATSATDDSFTRQALLILTPLGILLKGWEVSALHLVQRGEVGGTGLAGGVHVPLLGPMTDFGAVGGFTAYAGGGGNGARVDFLGAMALRLGVGLRTNSVVLALQGVGGLSGWREQIPASAEGGGELAARWMLGEFGPVLHFFARPTWVTDQQRRAASRLDGIHELALGMRVSVSREIPIAASISYAETMGTQMVVIGLGSGMLDWLVDYDR
jgi:hypothetical protein